MEDGLVKVHRIDEWKRNGKTLCGRTCQWVWTTVHKNSLTCLRCIKDINRARFDPDLTRITLSYVPPEYYIPEHLFPGKGSSSK